MDTEDTEPSIVNVAGGNSAMAQAIMESSCALAPGAAAAAAVAFASATRASLASPSLPHAHAMFATCCDSSPPSFLCRSNHEPVVLDARADAAARAERSAEPSESESELSGPID